MEFGRSSGNLIDLQVSKTFDKAQHHPYRLSGGGFNREVSMRDLVARTSTAKNMQVDETAVKIPQHWRRSTMTNPHRTQAELENNRKQGFKADPSYDLDGDGIVCNRDMRLSKIFDRDGDGKLNALERKNAEEAIRNVSLQTFQANVNRF